MIKFEESTKSKELKAIATSIKDENARSLDSRRCLHKKLFETLTFPIQYFEISKSTVMEGFEQLDEKAIALEHEIHSDTKILSIFHTNDASIVNPWIFDADNGTIQPFFEFPCSDAALLISKLKDLDNLQTRHKQQLTALKQEFKGYMDPIDDLDRRTQETHFRFEKVRLEYKTVELKKLFYNRLEVEFPNLSKSDIKFHSTWTEKHSAYKARLNALSKNYQTQVSEFIKSAVHQFPIASQQFLLKLKEEADHELALKKMEEMHQKLSEWRTQRIQDIQRSEEIRQFELMQTEGKREEAEARRRVELEEKRAAINEFKLKKREKQLELIEKYEQMEREQLAAVAEQRPHHRERINYRAGERLKKLELKRQEIENREELRLEIERKLDMLRSTVAVTIEPDWNRILRPTKSFQISKDTEKLPQLFVNNGFSVANLMKDRRFRISAALHQLGLQNSRYAHELFMKINRLPVSKEPY
ncbi:hypothetical protein BDR26DRAFT_869865 [Obelidium mucronatum]|nr:hypothetical protein BDR26DRAFT_869865 [Obelidium mucronatum]